ncbi:MAG: Sec-independent protein translocase protein TatB [Desulfovibrio sp.]|jgi:sec-independent protein translocase protein TatB|nr:Sec-independent protein translocase protein TatB [Desulfovibrio sp.]
MFGIGSTELLVILLVALIVLGPKSLAGIARTMGKAMGEFRRISTDFQRTLNAEAAQEEEVERKKRQSGTAGSSAPPQHDLKAAEAAADNAAAPQDRAEATSVPNTAPVSDAPTQLSPESPLAAAVAKTGLEAETAENAVGRGAVSGDGSKDNAA